MGAFGTSLPRTKNGVAINGWLIKYLLIFFKKYINMIFKQLLYRIFFAKNAPFNSLKSVRAKNEGGRLGKGGNELSL
jgi:hypothetical protein